VPRRLGVSLSSKATNGATRPVRTRGLSHTWRLPFVIHSALCLCLASRTCSSLIPMATRARSGTSGRLPSIRRARRSRARPAAGERRNRAEVAAGLPISARAATGGLSDGISNHWSQPNSEYGWPRLMAWSAVPTYGTIGVGSRSIGTHRSSECFSGSVTHAVPLHRSARKKWPNHDSPSLRLWSTWTCRIDSAISSTPASSRASRRAASRSVSPCSSTPPGMVKCPSRKPVASRLITQIRSRSRRITRTAEENFGRSRFMRSLSERTSSTQQAERRRGR
jgi:hypothetical protein